ncbi:hypothetical protein LEMLEM_LOCUS8392 [Lemmus lemmus]
MQRNSSSLASFLSAGTAHGSGSAEQQMTPRNTQNPALLVETRILEAYTKGFSFKTGDLDPKDGGVGE